MQATGSVLDFMNTRTIWPNTHLALIFWRKTAMWAGPGPGNLRKNNFAYVVLWFTVFLVEGLMGRDCKLLRLQCPETLQVYERTCHQLHICMGTCLGLPVTAEQHHSTERHSCWIQQPNGDGDAAAPCHQDHAVARLSVSSQQAQVHRAHTYKTHKQTWLATNTNMDRKHSGHTNWN